MREVTSATPEPEGEALAEWITETVLAFHSDAERYGQRLLQCAHWSMKAKIQLLDALPPLSAPSDEEREGLPFGQILRAVRVPASVLGAVPTCAGPCDCAECRRAAAALRRERIREEALRLMEAQGWPAAHAVKEIVALEAAVARLPDIGEPGV